MPPPRSKPTSQCQALEPDEKTRCSSKPLKGLYHCAIHYPQYQRLTKRYKEAQGVVDGMEGTPLPSTEEIARIKDMRKLQAEYGRMRILQDAVRVEKTGREVHHTRFFLRIDAGHKTRLNILERKMQENARVLNQLDARHYHLRNADDPDYMAWIKEFQDSPLESLAAAIPDDSGGHAEVMVERFPGVDTDPATAVVVPVDESEDDDPIDIALRNARRGHLRRYRWLTASSFEDFMSDIIPPEELHKADPGFVRAMEIKWTARVQYYRRLVLHDPVLANKAQGKTSFLDLLHSPDFALEDFDRLFGGVSLMGDALIWWKDAFLDAFDIRPSTKKRRDGSRVVLDIQGNRVKFLGQWVYSRRHKKALTTEGLYFFTKEVTVVKNMENRLIRLFHDFDEMHNYFILSGMNDDLVPDRVAHIKAARQYLMLAGYLVDELIGGRPPIPMFDGRPMPSNIPATKRGHRTWAQIHTRPYLVGAIRDDPEDPFCKAFLAELRSRPDLFIVVSHSVTRHRDGEVEQFGGLPAETYYCMRNRLFEAPASLQSPSSSVEWSIIRTAANTLIGGGESLPSFPGPSVPSFKRQQLPDEAKTPLGYLNLLRSGRRDENYMFSHVQFPLRYLVVMDVTHNTDGQSLTTYTVWAAFRALGLVQGWDVTPAALDRAATKLMTLRMSKLFAWMPEDQRPDVLMRNDPVIQGAMADSETLYAELAPLELD